MGREWSWSRSLRRGEKEKETPPGCMSSVFQLFDLHQILFGTTTTTHCRTEGDSFPQDQHVASSRGVVAPRNSLELEEVTVSLASVVTGEEEYDVPVLEKKTPLDFQREKKVEERTASASSRTGNVVARLMGLDQIPDQAAPRTSFGNYSQELESPSLLRPHQLRMTQQGDASRRETAVTPPPRRPLQPRNTNILVVPDDVRHGTRSLPETPRMSSARRSWDTDPRLSLQLHYKENALPAAVKDLRCSCDSPGDYSVSISPSFAKSKRRVFRQQLEENRSPSRYAQEIMKQVKESVTRRIAGRDCDDSLVRPKAGATKGSDRKTAGEEPRQGRTSTAPSGSPRLRLLSSPKDKPDTLAANDTHILNSSPRLLFPSPSPPHVQPSSPSLPTSDREIVKAALKPAASSDKRKKATPERFMERIRKPPLVAAREESFVAPSSSTQPRKKFHPSLPAFVPGKRKKSVISPPPPPQSHVQVSAPPMLPQISNQLLRCDVDGDSRKRSNTSASAGPDDFQYVKCILERTGVQSLTPFPFATTRWYSPSHPVDPLLFHQLERSFMTSPGHLRHRCNRRLLFNLVDEVLADVLWPVLHAPAWPRSCTAKGQRQRQRPDISDGEALMQSLWSQIRSYPSADCRLIEDIESLLEADLPAANVRQLLLHPAVAEEAGSVASELEEAILESLVGEAAAALLTPPCVPARRLYPNRSGE